MRLKPKINALQRTLGKLCGGLSCRSADGDACWYGLWRMLALTQAVRSRLGRLSGKQVSLLHPDYIVLLKEAAQLGISTNPEVKAVELNLRRFVYLAHAAFNSEGTWEERQMFADDVSSASSAAAGVIMRAWGIVWDGYMPPRPPGMPPVTTLPAWVDELTDEELERLKCILTPTEVQEWATELGMTDLDDMNSAGRVCD